MQTDNSTLRRALGPLMSMLSAVLGLTIFVTGCGGGNEKNDAKKNESPATKDKDSGKTKQDGSAGGDGSGSK